MSKSNVRLLIAGLGPGSGRWSISIVIPQPSLYNPKIAATDPVANTIIAAIIARGIPAPE
jgi:hypothetical protein